MVYILEFSRPVSGHCRYYIGWTKNEHTYFARMKLHRAGRGAALTREAIRQGIKWRTVLIIPDADRNDERRLKNWKNAGKVVRAYRNRGYSASL